MFETQAFWGSKLKLPPTKCIMFSNTLQLCPRPFQCNTVRRPLHFTRLLDFHQVWRLYSPTQRLRWDLFRSELLVNELKSAYSMVFLLAIQFNKKIKEVVIRSLFCIATYVIHTTLGTCKPFFLDNICSLYCEFSHLAIWYQIYCIPIHTAISDCLELSANYCKYSLGKFP